MDYVGKICPYCQTKLEEGDDVVTCSICEMPHHKECWIENRACTTFGCTGTISGGEDILNDALPPVFCVNCGTQQRAMSKFCSACGFPVQEAGGPHFQAAADPSAISPQPAPPVYTPPVSPTPTAYATPQPVFAPPATGQQPNGNIGGQPGADPQDTFAFIQTNQAFYAENFQKLQAPGSYATWNWSAFLFGGAWFGYRKMYPLAGGWAAIAFVFQLIARGVPVLGWIGMIIMWVCAGFFGNYFYKQYVDNALRIVPNMDPITKTTYMAQRGGTSIGGAAAVIGIGALLGIITAL